MSRREDGLPAAVARLLLMQRAPLKKQGRCSEYAPRHFPRGGSNERDNFPRSSRWFLGLIFHGCHRAGIRAAQRRSSCVSASSEMLTNGWPHFLWPASTNAASLSSAMRQPVSLSADEIPDGRLSCTPSTSVPSPASVSVNVTTISPRIAESAVSNSSTWTTCSSGTSLTNRPPYVSVCALVLPVPVG